MTDDNATRDAATERLAQERAAAASAAASIASSEASSDGSTPGSPASCQPASGVTGSPAARAANSAELTAAKARVRSA